MTKIEKFLKDNHLRQSDLAKYLGVRQSTISYYCNGAAMPDYHLQKIRENENGWNTDALIIQETYPTREKPLTRNTVMESMQGQIDVLNRLVQNQDNIISNQSRIIANQSVIISNYEAIIKTYFQLNVKKDD